MSVASWFMYISKKEDSKTKMQKIFSSKLSMNKNSSAGILYFKMHSFLVYVKPSLRNVNSIVHYVQTYIEMCIITS